MQAQPERIAHTHAKLESIVCTHTHRNVPEEAGRTALLCRRQDFRGKSHTHAQLERIMCTHANRNVSKETNRTVSFPQGEDCRALCAHTHTKKILAECVAEHNFAKVKPIETRAHTWAQKIP